MRVTSNFKVDAIDDGTSVSQGQRRIYKVTRGRFQYVFVQFHCEYNPEIYMQSHFLYRHAFCSVFCIRSVFSLNQKIFLEDENGKCDQTNSCAALNAMTK